MKNRNIVGVILVLLGISFIINQLGIVPNFGNYVSTWWPIIFILIGVIQIFETKSITGPVILVLIGIGLILNNLNYVFGFWNFFWPAILILIGLNFIFDKNKYIKQHFNAQNSIDESNIDYFCLFGGIENRNSSKNFSGGSITAIFGGADLDLRDSILSPNGATLDLFAAFGGVDIKVPQGMKVVITGIPIFGGCDNKTYYNNQSLDINTPVLTIKYIALFGGVDIKN